jgi:hypothetical protein
MNFQLHPWHSVIPGEDAPEYVNCIIRPQCEGLNRIKNKRKKRQKATGGILPDILPAPISAFLL